MGLLLQLAARDPVLKRTLPNVRSGMVAIYLRSLFFGALATAVTVLIFMVYVSHEVRKLHLERQEISLAASTGTLWQSLFFILELQ
jgi:hypothetical protein